MHIIASMSTWSVSVSSKRFLPCQLQVYLHKSLCFWSQLLSSSVCAMTSALSCGSHAWGSWAQVPIIWLAEWDLPKPLLLDSTPWPWFCVARMTTFYLHNLTCPTGPFDTCINFQKASAELVIYSHLAGQIVTIVWYIPYPISCMSSY